MLSFTANYQKTLNAIVAKAINTGVGITQDFDMPLNAEKYHVWHYFDPHYKKPVGFKVYLPFKEVLLNTEGVDPSIAKDMPDICCWANLCFEHESMSQFYKDAVPKFDPNFVPDRRHVLRLLSLISKPVVPGSGRGYYGFGEAGIGKTSTALWLFSVLRQAVVHMNCKRDMVGEEFFLFQTANNGKWEQTHGPMLRAVMHNWPIIIDEMDLGPDAFWPSINNLIEGHQFAVPGYKDFHVRAGTNFRVIGFGNTGPGREIGKYKGRSSIDASFFDRMVKDYYETLTQEQMYNILYTRFKDKLSEDLLTRLSRFAVSINNAVAMKDFPEMISPRSLIAICNDMIEYKNFAQQPLLCAIGNALGTTLRDISVLMKMLNTYAADICSNALQINDLESMWINRDCPPLVHETKKSKKKASQKASETDENNADASTAEANAEEVA